MRTPPDNLEQFVNSNRQLFDRYSPPASLRKRIFASTSAGRKMLVRRRLLIAASLMLLAAVPSFLIVTTIGPSFKKLVAEKSHPELKESELYYQALMSNVFNEANNLFSSMPDLENEIRTDLRELDDIGRDLRSDLKDNVDNREVVEALIRNYRIRIRILEELLNEISHGQNHIDKKNNHEL